MARFRLPTDTLPSTSKFKPDVKEVKPNDFNKFVELASQDGIRFTCASKRSHHTRSAGSHTVRWAVDHELYVQHGLGYSRTKEEIMSPADLVYGSGWDSAISEYLNGLPETRNLQMSRKLVWVKGKGPPAHTYTHNDDYDNFAMVLSGSKTFYVMSPDTMAMLKGFSASKGDVKAPLARKRQRGSAPNEEPWALPDDIVPLPSEISKEQTMTNFFTKIELGKGDLLYIPHDWYHYVVTEPNTIMVNWWYTPVGDADWRSNLVEGSETDDLDTSSDGRGESINPLKMQLLHLMNTK